MLERVQVGWLFVKRLIGMIAKPYSLYMKFSENVNNRKRNKGDKNKTFKDFPREK